MPYQANDIVKIVSEATLFTETVRNVWHYEITEAGPDLTAEELLAAFQTAVIAPLCGIQVTDVVYDTLTVDNLTDGLSFGELALTSVEGNLAGPAMPSFVAYSFKLLRGSKLTRNGFKRVAGVPESETLNNVLSPGFLASGQAAAATNAIADNVVSGAPGVTLTMRPVILGRRPDSVPSYVFQAVSGVELQNAVTTQVSRKRGRGE